mmetsp:Transcript_15404/g.27087  ORF Transcript_15404/g.27087 Transcript_15404/m.27087 type:complete len:2097 (+) Transcript_15404:54-6344(+)
MNLELWWLCIALAQLCVVSGFKLDSGHRRNSIEPYEQGFVGTYGDGETRSRTRINPGGAVRTKGIHGEFVSGVKFHPENKTLSFLPGLSRTSQVYRFEVEGVISSQACPGETGPWEDGAYYCTSPLHGICDRRTGMCHCYKGYQGTECEQCQPTHIADKETGKLCVPKKLCPADCNGAGTCDFVTGTCACASHRTGADCSIKKCLDIDPLCERCELETGKCLKCVDKYFFDTDKNQCVSCTQFDPRCVTCEMGKGCLQCSDPLLNSIRRSGRRKVDVPLPFDEDSRELSKEHAFGTKSADFFDEAEPFYLIEDKIGGGSVACEQGVSGIANPEWVCSPHSQSHVVCGHYGTLSFSSASYTVIESAKYVKITVRRTGGGNGKISVLYSLRHISTDTSDVTATARYTTSQKLTFLPGVVSLTFRVTIHDDAILEPDERFELILYDSRVVDTGENVALGPQHRTVVVVLDDDYWITSHSESAVIGTFQLMQSGVVYPYRVQIATSVGFLQADPLELDQRLLTFSSTTGTKGAFYERDLIRKFGSCTYESNGLYDCSVPIDTVNHSFVHVLLTRPGGLKGLYYDNAMALDEWLQLDGEPKSKPVLERIDPYIFFVWGRGALIDYARDFVSIRWEGGLTLPTLSNFDHKVYFRVHANDHARLYIDGQLIMDHWNYAPLGDDAIGAAFLEADKIHSIVLEYRELTGQAHVKLMWSHDGTAFNLIKPDSLHHIYHMDKSPYAGSVVVSPISPLHSVASGTCLHNTIAGHSCSFLLHPHDEFNNHNMDLEGKMLEVSIALDTPTSVKNHLSSSIISVGKVERNSLLSYEASYVATGAGRHKVSVTIDGEHIFNSPFDLDVAVDVPHGPTSDASGAGLDLDDVHEVGVAESFSMTLRDAYGNIVENTDFCSEFLIQVTHKEYPYDNFEGACEYLGEGEYRGSYTVTRAGLYNIHISIGCQRTSVGIPCEPIANSPYQGLFTHTDLDPETTFASGPGISKATSAITASFTLHARDRFGNPVLVPTQDEAGKFVITLAYDGDEEHDPNGSCTHDGDDMFTCTYTPTKAQHDGVPLHVKHSETKIMQGFAFDVAITDGACSASESYAYGEATEKTTAGTLVTFLVQAVDAAGNKRTSPCAGELSIAVEDYLHSLKTTYQESGVYLMQYNMSKSGTHAIRVLLGEVEIGNSPLSIVSQPNVVSYATSLVTGDGLLSGVAGEIQPIAIQAVDVHGNYLTDGKESHFVVRLLENDAEKQTILWKDAVNNGDGTYDASFQPIFAQDQDTAIVQVQVAQSGGVDATYYDWETADTIKKTQVDASINFDWSHPNDRVVSKQSRGWSAQWVGLIRAPLGFDATNYELDSAIDRDTAAPPPLKLAFRVRIQGGGVRLWIERTKVASHWPVATVGITDWVELPDDITPRSFLSFRMEFSKTLESSTTTKLALEWRAVRKIQRNPASDGDHAPTYVSSGVIPESAFFRWRTVKETLPVYVPAVTSAPTSYVVSLDFLNDVVSGIQSAFKVQLVDVYGNKQIHYNDRVVVFAWEQTKHLREDHENDGLTPPGAIQPVVTATAERGVYDVKFTPTLSGTFILFVAVNPPVLHADFGTAEHIDILYEHSVLNFPTKMNISPGACAASTSFVYGDYVNATVAGVMSHFFIQAVDSANNFRHVEGDVTAISFKSDAEGKPWWLQVKYISNGLYRVDYIIYRSGKWTTHVTMSDGEDITQEVEVTPAEAHGPSCEVQVGVPQPINSAIQSLTPIQVVAKDQFGNQLWRGGDDFVLELHIKDKFTPYILTGSDISPEFDRYEYDIPWVDYLKKREDHQDGTYTFYFDLFKIVGKFKLSINLALGVKTSNTTGCNRWGICATPKNVENFSGGLLGTYYTTSAIQKTTPAALARVDEGVNFDWGVSPLAAADLSQRPVGHWGPRSVVRWTGYIKPEHTGQHKFSVAGTPDQVLLRVAGNQLASNEDVIFLRKERLYPIEIKLTQLGHRALVTLEWGVALGANREGSTPDVVLDAKAKVTQYSATVYTDKDLSDDLAIGDEIRISKEEFVVRHYDAKLLILRLDKPYKGESQENTKIERRIKQTVVPPSRLFYASVPLEQSPIIVETN